MKSYQVAAIKSEGYWHLEIEGFIQGTQARSITEAVSMAKDFINSMTEEPLEEISINLRILQN